MELLSRQMEKLSPLVRVVLIQLHFLQSFFRFLFGITIGFARRWSIDELQNLKTGLISFPVQRSQ